MTDILSPCGFVGIKNRVTGSFLFLARGSGVFLFYINFYVFTGTTKHLNILILLNIENYSKKL